MSALDEPRLKPPLALQSLLSGEERARTEALPERVYRYCQEQDIKRAANGSKLNGNKKNAVQRLFAKKAQIKYAAAKVASEQRCRSGASAASVTKAMLLG